MGECNGLRQRGRVLLVEANEYVQERFTRALPLFGWSTVTAFSANDARSLWNEPEIVVAVLDLECSDGTGLSLVAELRRPPAPVAAVGLVSDRSTPTIEAALRIGVSQLLLKSALTTAMVNAVERAAEHTAEMREWMADGSELVDELPMAAEGPEHTLCGLALEHRLTDRQTQALLAVVRGHSDKEIQTRLGVSYSRVRQLITGGFRKMGIRNRNDFIRFLWEREQGGAPSP